jgi:hypothetical protein
MGKALEILLGRTPRSIQCGYTELGQMKLLSRCASNAFTSEILAIVSPSSALDRRALTGLWSSLNRDRPRRMNLLSYWRQSLTCGGVFMTSGWQDDVAVMRDFNHNCPVVPNLRPFQDSGWLSSIRFVFAPNKVTSPMTFPRLLEIAVSPLPWKEP